MSIWRKPDGETIVICDGCGIAEDGTRPDLSELVKLDMTAEIRQAGAPAGTELQVTDYCSDCTAARSPDQARMDV